MTRSHDDRPDEALLAATPDDDSPSPPLAGIGAKLRPPALRSTLLDPRAPMPSFRNLGARRLRDLVFYLSELRRQPRSFLCEPVGRPPPGLNCERGRTIIRDAMATARRGAVRLIGGQPGLLGFSRRSIPCVVVDLSVTGARVRLMEPQLVADQVLLTTTVAEQEITIPGEVRRSEPGGVVAMSFPEAETSRLGRLLAAEQRSAIAGGRRAIVERRRAPRPE